MQQQLKCISTICLILAFFGCESLPPAEKAGEQQNSLRQLINFNNNWQNPCLETKNTPVTEWEQVFLPHSVKIQPLVVVKRNLGEKYYFNLNNLVEAEAGIATILLRTKEFNSLMEIEAPAEGLPPATLILK